MYIGVVYNFRGLKIPILIRIIVVFVPNYVHLLDFDPTEQDYNKIQTIWKLLILTSKTVF